MKIRLVSLLAAAATLPVFSLTAVGNAAGDGRQPACMEEMYGQACWNYQEWKAKGGGVVRLVKRAPAPAPPVVMWEYAGQTERPWAPGYLFDVWWRPNHVVTTQEIEQLRAQSRRYTRCDVEYGSEAAGWWIFCIDGTAPVCDGPGVSTVHTMQRAGRLFIPLSRLCSDVDQERGEPLGFDRNFPVGSTVGAVTFTTDTSGQPGVLYTPDATYQGRDRVTIRAKDSWGHTSNAVTLEVEITEALLHCDPYVEWPTTRSAVVYLNCQLGMAPPQEPVRHVFAAPSSGTLDTTSAADGYVTYTPAGDRGPVAITFTTSYRDQLVSTTITI